MAIDLAKLVVRLEAQSAQFLTELEKANRRLDKFESATARTLRKWTGNLVAAFSIKAAIGFTKDIIDAEAALGDMAQRTGESVETISRLQYAAEQSSASVEDLSASYKGLAKSASAAAEGNKEAVAAFKAVDVSVEDSSGNLKGTEELLLDLADQFSRYEDGLQKTAAAQRIFGKSGEAIIPFLNKGRAGVEELLKKADALGITLSTKGAQAADAFNNRLNTLGHIAKAIVGKALEEVLPIVERLTDGFEAGAEGTQKWDQAARVLAAGMKILITTGLVLGEIFDQVGTAIGNAAGALGDIAQGKFKEAFNQIRAAQANSLESIEETGRQIADVWSDTADSVVDDLSEVEVKVRKVFDSVNQDAFEEMRKKLEAAGKALTESVATPYERLQATIKKADELLAAHVITLETWKRAVAAAADEVDPFLGAIARMGGGIRDLGEGIREELEKSGAGLEDEIQKSVDKINDQFDKAFEARQKQTEAVIDEMKRNTQDILADGLEDALHSGIEKGAAGALDAFGKMLEKMALQAIAAKIADKIFGSSSTAGLPNGSGGGGWLDTIIDIGSKIFGATGPSRDSGGRGQRGQAYMIGRGAQPEMFVPDQAGSFYPAGQWAGSGRGVTQNIYTTSPITQRSARQLEIEASRRQRLATARLG